MPTEYTKENKPGQAAQLTLTWNEATRSWEDTPGTWDEPMKVDATSFTKETKPDTSFTKE